MPGSPLPALNRVASSQKLHSAMNATVLAVDASLEDNTHKYGRSTFQSLDSVFALLDEERSRQLVQRVIPAVTYTGPFEVVGREDGLDPPTQLCSPCKRLIQQPPPIFLPEGRKTLWDLPPERFWIPHHDTLFQLIDCCFSQSGSCRLCHLFWNGLRRETVTQRLKKAENSRFDWHDGGLKVAIQEFSTARFGLGLNIVLGPPYRFFKNFNIWMTRSYSGNELEQSPIISESTDSASTYSQIQKWIDHCLHNHSLCQIPRPTNSEQPTRLIFMDHTAGTFQLATEVAPDTRYAAVSYRWGSEAGHYMLTEETAGCMRKGVSMKFLSKTILNTFSIAYHLDLKYIWVDRLCILQDSHEDWSREASRMALIYKHAFLTISASCASHENQGCFRKRDVAGIQPLGLNLNPLLPPGTPASVDGEASYISSTEPEEAQKSGGKLGYLADRGWTFQERIISRRIVHFAEEEVYWECRKLEGSETWPDGAPFKIPLRPSLVYGSGNERWDKYSPWHKVVQDYSARVFTYHEDKLPALSGLARETAEMREDTDERYLAGLWQSTVVFGLCWINESGTLRIPEHYLAPSWSWASLHGKISYNVCGLGLGYGPAVKFKDARFRFATADPYGAVHDGWIHLFGHLKPVAVVRRTLPELFQPRGPCDVGIRSTDGEPLPFLDRSAGTLDIDTFAAGRKVSVPMFCLPVLRNQQYDSETEYCPDFYCLLLVRNGSIKYKRSGEALPSPTIQHAEQFQRAGLVRITIGSWVAFKEWLAESPEQDIVIR